jgi:hypothetical protein
MDDGPARQFEPSRDRLAGMSVQGKPGDFRSARRASRRWYWALLPATGLSLPAGD